MTSDNAVKLDTFSSYKKYLVQNVGREQVNDLHKESKLMDFVIVFGWVGLVVLNSICICLSFELHWLVPLMFMQGLLFTQLGLINHEFIVHRRVFGPKFSWFVGMFLSLPTLIKSTNYSFVHMTHHRFIGSERDGEDYKQDLGG